MSNINSNISRLVIQICHLVYLVRYSIERVLILQPIFVAKVSNCINRAWSLVGHFKFYITWYIKFFCYIMSTQSGIKLKKILILKPIFVAQKCLTALKTSLANSKWPTRPSGIVGHYFVSSADADIGRTDVDTDTISKNNDHLWLLGLVGQIITQISFLPSLRRKNLKSSPKSFFLISKFPPDWQKVCKKVYSSWSSLSGDAR